MDRPNTFGRIVRQMQVGDSDVIETVHPALTVLPCHDHSTASLTIALAGHYAESFGHRRVLCDASTVVIKPAGQFHSNEYGAADTRCVTVAFGPRDAAHIHEFSNVLDSLWTVCGGTAAAAMQELSRELRFGGDGSCLIVEECIWRVLGYAERQRRSARLAGRPTWLGRIEEFIRENAHRRLSLAELAALADVHPAHLNKVFKRHLRVSVGHYLRKSQIERACGLLTETSIPLACVASEAGFCDQGHFTRVFRSITGTTPSNYRRDIGALNP